MQGLDWEKVKSFYLQNPVSHTKMGSQFLISRVTEAALYVDLPSKNEYISRENLEKAVKLIFEGESIRGPYDYRTKVCDQRPAYAWAVLRDMGFVQGEKIDL